MKHKVAIIGKGNVGAALKKGLDRAGYDTKITGRGGARATAEWGEVVILAVPYSEVDAAAKELGAAVKGKTVIDVTNPLTKEFGLAIGFTTSAAEEIQKKLPGAKVVKGFNSVFASCMDSGMVKGQQVSVPIAGDDEKARSAGLQLARDIGFDAIDAGPLSNARWIEALGYLNIQLGFMQKMGTDIGFKLVH